MSGSPGIHHEFSENAKEISLFDPDSKDSGYSGDLPEENDSVVSSPLSLEDHEATILCFSPKEAALEITPCKKLFLGKKKRLFLSSENSPSVLAARSLKRLKIFDLDYEEPADIFGELPLDSNNVLFERTSEKAVDIGEVLPLDFSDKLLAEHSDEEAANISERSSVLDEDSIDINFSNKTLTEPACEEIFVDLNDEISYAYSVEARKVLVKEAVEKSEEADLIGDFSKSYALPLVMGSHPDLKSISVDTMKDVLEGKFRNIISSVKIIDSRYPYEFQGGHIKGAINLYTKEDCLDLLNLSGKPKNERHVLIFHCEFSQERGPNMVRSLRQEDRTRNTRNYPALIYPEVYILDGGYKRFYQTFPQHCDPMAYKQMLHPEHAEEMRFFRKKSKTSDNILKTSKKKQLMPRSSKAVRKFLSNDF